MNSGVNWGRLYEQGRCKAIGIPWSEQEARAVFIDKIPAEFVREGCLTGEDYAKALAKRTSSESKTGKKALVHLKHEELVRLCEKRGIQVTDEAPRPALIETLIQAGVPKSVTEEDYK